MPTAFSQFDQSFHAMEGRDTDAKLRAVQDYLYQLLEQLRYILNNLTPDNFNEQEVSGWAGETIVKPIHAEITDVEQGLVTLIDATAGEINASVQGIYAAEWTSGFPYYAADIVKVTTTSGGATTVTYYKCKAQHTSANGNKPPNATYWDVVTQPTVQSVLNIGLGGITLSYDNTQIGSGEHNGAYITLNKDGTTIGGGKVFVKDLDASTITTGTLDAGDINLLNSFTVYEGAVSAAHKCGVIGGFNDGYVSALWMSSTNDEANEKAVICQSDKVLIHSNSFDRTGTQDIYRMELELTPTTAKLTKVTYPSGGTRTTKTIDLFDMEARITALGG